MSTSQALLGRFENLNDQDVIQTTGPNGLYTALNSTGGSGTAPTPTAVMGVFDNPNNQDLIQSVGQGGSITTLLSAAGGSGGSPTQEAIIARVSNPGSLDLIQTIDGSGNITTVLSSSGSGVVFTPTYTDDFTPNSNPLNASNWLIPTGDDGLKATSGVCYGIALGGGVISSETLIASTAPSTVNQYAKITLDRWILGNGQDFFLTIDADEQAQTNGYFIGVTDNGDGVTAQIYIVDYFTSETLYEDDSAIVAANDTFLIAYLDDILYVYQSGTLFYSGTPPTTAASPNIYINLEADEITTSHDVGISDFIAGTVS